MPSRILDNHTGGNTTYARAIAAGLVDHGVTVAKLPRGSHPALTMAAETWAGLQRGTEQDILHYVADTGPLLRTRRPSVVTVHGVASRWISSARTASQERVWRARVQRAIRSTDHVITVSRSSARDVQEVFGVDTSRITTIEHGIDVPKFQAAVTLSRELTEILPRDYALYLGNIEPRKNLAPLVAAFERPEIKRLGVPLVIAGKPAWNSDETMRAISAATNTIHVGFVSDQDRTALMQSATVFAFPSLYEGFGFPVLEALAAGAVVITSDRGSLADVAGPALRFASLDEAGIAEGIAQAIADDHKRSAVRAAGRDWAARYTWEASVREHLGVYERLLT